MPPVVRHLQIAHERGVYDRPFSEPSPYLLDGVIQSFPSVAPCVIHKKGKLLRLILWDQVDSPNGHRPHTHVPSVMLSKCSKSRGRDFRWALRLERQLALKLRPKEVVAPNADLYAFRRETVNAEPVPYVLGKLQYHLPDLVFVEQIRHAGDPVPDGLHGRYKVLVHDPRCVRSVGEPPQHDAVYAKQPFETIRVGGGSIIDAAREQWNDGANTLAVAPGEVITYSRNYVTNRILRENGLTVHEIPSSELSRGRGGPRCMSMPFVREPIEK